MCVCPIPLAHDLSCVCPYLKQVQTILELYEENKEEWIELDALLPDDMPTVTKNDETEVVDGMNEIAYLLNADEFEEEEAEEEDGRDDRDEQMGYATGQHRHRHIRKDNMQRENPIKNLHESAQNSNSPSLRQDQHYSRNNKHPITDEHKNDNNDRDDYDAGRTSEVDPMAALLGLDLDTMDLDTITNEELEAILADLVGMEALLLQVR